MKSYIKKLLREGLGYDSTEDDLIKNIGYTWKSFGSLGYSDMSGWKFHIYGTTLEDSGYLLDKLGSVVSKWGGLGKVGGVHQVNSKVFHQGGLQEGKQGATIYIPKHVIDTNKQNEMLNDIRSSLSNYRNRGGKIRGDKEITPQIHYRYELVEALPAGGIKDSGDYRRLYNKNSGGPYKPGGVMDIFNMVDDSSEVNYLSTNFGDTSGIDWSKIKNATNVEEYDRIINKAISTNNLGIISRGGFEKYGIPNFRHFIKNKI
jgi:hypothetical protein